MVLIVEHRFGQINELAEPIEWLTDNGSCYTAHDTRRFARDIGLVPCTTPVESPQSNGMAEAFVRTLKRDYARVNPRPDARTVSHSGSEGGAGSRRGNSTRPERAIFTKYPSCDFIPISMIASEVGRPMPKNH